MPLWPCLSIRAVRCWQQFENLRPSVQRMTMKRLLRLVTVGTERSHRLLLAPSEAKFVKASEAVNMDVAAFKFLQAGGVSCVTPSDLSNMFFFLIEHI